MMLLAVGLNLYACGSKDEPTSTKTKEAPQTSAIEQTKPAEPNKPQVSTDSPLPTDSQPKPTARPADHYMASRCQVEWRMGGDKLYDSFDLERLYFDNNTDQYNIAYLLRFIRLYATSPEGAVYYFTDEDYTKTEVQSIRYLRASEVIELSLRYKGSTTNKLRLHFPLYRYYDRQVRLRDDFAPHRYAEGFARHPDLYLADVLLYDRERYAVTILKEGGITIGNEGRNVSFTIRIADAKTDEVIASVQKTLGGFRPLTLLRTDMTIASSYALEDYLRRRLKTMKTYDKLSEYLERSLGVWAKHLQLSLRGRQLLYREPGSWEPEVLSKDLADLYLTNARFELRAAQLEGRNLKLRLALTWVNEVALEDVEYELTAVSVLD